MILVVGATGQLGTRVTRLLCEAGQPVRALARRTSSYAHLASAGAEIAIGDLRDETSLMAACSGVDTIIATANSVIRRRGDTFREVDDLGYQRLIAAARAQGVKQFIYASVPVTPMDRQVQALDTKRRVEQYLIDTGLNYTIVRLSVFMDVWLALVGSHIPTRNTEAATVVRPFWFSRLFMRMVGGLVERRGIAVVAGDGTARHAFITVEDAARVLVGCVGNQAFERAVLHVGGPEVLTWDQAMEIFATALGRSVRPIHLPAPIFRVGGAVLGPIAEGPANILNMNWAMGSADSAYPPEDAQRVVGSSLTTMEAFLRAKLASAPEAARAPILGGSR